jgi:hypothetical protein
MRIRRRETNGKSQLDCRVALNAAHEHLAPVLSLRRPVEWILSSPAGWYRPSIAGLALFRRLELRAGGRGEVDPLNSISRLSLRDPHAPALVGGAPLDALLRGRRVHQPPHVVLCRRPHAFERERNRALGVDGVGRAPR